jgi:hypothetical protein
MGNSVIASQRVGAKRRPMREAIQKPQRRKGWIASSQVLLAMTFFLSHSNFMSRHFVMSDPSPELMMMQPRTFRAVLSLAHTA